MFDQFKDRFAKLEEDHESLRKAHQHVEKYQLVYAVAGSSALTLVGVKLFGKPQVIVKGTEGLPLVISPVFNNHNIGNSVTNNLGPCCKIVQDIDDPSKLWPKITTLAEEIAEEHGMSVDAARVMLSRHFRGELEHVFNKRYRPYGVTTTG